MRVAVVGAGVSGLAAAHRLAEAGVDVVLYEKEDYLGGHAKTVTVEGVDLDLAFMVFNRVTYPNMTEFFEKLGVEMELSDMSFSVSLDEGKGYEWGSRNGLSGLFAQKSNALNPYFWRMIREVLKFKDDVLLYLEEHENNLDMDRSETLEHFIKSHGYSELFQKCYLIPICASIWSCPAEGVLSFSAYSVLSFCRNHHLLQLFGRPQWLTVKSRSQCYVSRVREELESRSCKIRTGYAVQSVVSTDGGCRVIGEDHSEEIYDGCIISAHAPDALKLLGPQATYEESMILGAFQYVYSDIYLHHDKSFMPQNPSAWSSWNFLGTTQQGVCVTYWLNLLQNLGCTKLPFLVTLNPPRVPNYTLLKWCTSHPFPSVAASKASSKIDGIQGKRAIWFAGAYQGYGFHEDGLKAGIAAANNVLGKDYILLRNPKHMVPSLMECGARLFVTKFLESYISAGCLTLLEEGGTMYAFEGTNKKDPIKSVIKVHNTLFYWKIATEADLGLADAYINGYFSFVDKEQGLLDLLMGYEEYFWKEFESNEFFSLFLDETMTYSCAIFKTEYEDLKIAQLRKISLLIKRYTGITLSEEQLHYAKRSAKEAGLEDHITFMLIDYRQLPNYQKYDRIISCEMIEGVGHEYMEEFFGCCESLLAENGIFVLQFISIPDHRYDEYRRSSDFIKEYIFPGGCLPSLTRITTAMATSSKLCVEHIENIGIHYYHTLIYWRNNFFANKEKILALGFDERFVRTWEYYFMYCAAGFKSCTLGNYQIVFSRPGNVWSFGEPCKRTPRS